MAMDGFILSSSWAKETLWPPGWEEAGLSNRKWLAQTPSMSRLELRIEPGSLLVCPRLTVAESLLPRAPSLHLSCLWSRSHCAYDFSQELSLDSATMAGGFVSILCLTMS